MHLAVVRHVPAIAALPGTMAGDPVPAGHGRGSRRRRGYGSRAADRRQPVRIMSHAIGHGATLYARNSSRRARGTTTVRWSRSTPRTMAVATASGVKVGIRLATAGIRA